MKKKAIKFFASIAIALSAMTAVQVVHASTIDTNVVTIDTSKMTKEQVKEAVDAAFAAKKDVPIEATAQKAVAKITDVSTWGTNMAQAAKGFAEAIGIAAHELNIQANDFAASPVGKMTIAFIILKLFGATVFGLIGAVAGVIGVLYICRRMNVAMTYECSVIEVKKPALLFGLIGERTVRVKEYKRINADEYGDGQFLFGLVIPVVLSVITLVIFATHCMPA